MIETLISSKTRIKLLLKFFLNSNSTAYLRGLETEFGDSSNAIRLELNRFEKAGMLNTSLEGNKKIFRANTQHPLFSEIHNIVLKYIGFDKIIDNVIENLGDIKKVYVTGAFAKGVDDQVIDLVFVGKLNRNYLLELIEKVEKHISRKIKYVVYTEDEMIDNEFTKKNSNVLLLWEN